MDPKRPGLDHPPLSDPCAHLGKFLFLACLLQNLEIPVVPGVCPRELESAGKQKEPQGLVGTQARRGGMAGNAKSALLELRMNSNPVSSSQLLELMAESRAQEVTVCLRADFRPSGSTLPTLPDLG